MTRVLLAVDEPGLLEALCVTLHAQGFEVAVGVDQRRLSDHVASFRPGLVVLDLCSAGLDDIAVVTELRGWSQVPIVAVSGERAGAAPKEVLDAGADHCMARPFEVGDLVAQIQAVSRRIAAEQAAPAIRVGDYLVDVDARSVHAAHPGPAGPQPRLTPTEWQILELLLRNPGRLITGPQLLAHLGKDPARLGPGYVRQFIAQIRRKLEPDPANPRYLITRAGMGYQFRPAHGSKR